MPAQSPRVVVVGGGNAAMCAAMAARDAGASVTVLERAEKPFRGGNTRHTRNIRTAHSRGDGFVTGPYEQDELLADLASVTGEDMNRTLAELTVAQSAEIIPWMEAHGAHWQAPLRGTLGLARTNHFFLGGGKSLLNAYYLTAQRGGIDIRYRALVTDLDIQAGHCAGAKVRYDGEDTEEYVAAEAFVVACGGFEANLDWLAEYWGPAAHNFVVRGTPHNDGLMLRQLLDAGARRVGDPASAHAIAVDARAPQFDAGIVTRLDAIPIGIAVNCEARRFYDEGEEIWPKRYATWGRLVALQPEQRAFVIYDSKVAGETIPGLYRPFTADTVEDLATRLGLDPGALGATVREYNDACRVGRFTLAEKDECHTEGLQPAKSHWARPISVPPYFGYPLRPGITFTYMGVAVDADARIQTTDGGALANVFAAGEIMSGNVLTRGYLAGFGMTIGSVWGRIAGRAAAHA